MLLPLEDIVLSDWAEKNLILPEGQRARLGPTTMWPYMREIIDMIGDRSTERMTIVKSARVGYTKVSTAE